MRRSVCHGGSGTTLAALAFGLPLLIVPQGADQHANAAACERVGCARILDLATLTSGAVADAVAALLQPSAPERAAAEAIADEINAMPAPAQVAADLQAFATA